jgi:chemotaxis protein CheX
VEISGKIIDATVEIFTTMLMMDIIAGEPIKREKIPFASSITGMIGLAGLYKGVLAVHTPEKVAMNITSNFLGMDVEEINEDVLDAIGELTNMLGGSVKSILSDTGKDIELSIPSTISGEKYNFQIRENADLLVIPFKVDDGQQFLVELQLEVQPMKDSS